MYWQLSPIILRMAPQAKGDSLVRHHTHIHGLTKDDGLLGGGAVRVDKVDGGVDRGVGRLGKDAIHLFLLFP